MYNLKEAFIHFQKDLSNLQVRFFLNYFSLHQKEGKKLEKKEKRTNI